MIINMTEVNTDKVQFHRLGRCHANVTSFSSGFNVPKYQRHQKKSQCKNSLNDSFVQVVDSFWKKELKIKKYKSVFSNISSF